MKKAPVRNTGVFKDVWLDYKAFYMAEICPLEGTNYPKYFIKLSHKYIAGCCVEIGNFVSADAAEEWLENFWRKDKKDA